jgi:hypothetical protein
MSYTQYMHAELVLAKQRIVKTTGMSYEAYSHMMFEYGCRFARDFASKYVNPEDVYKSLTENYSWGFWRWWRVKWTMDDAALLHADCFTDDIPYTAMKDTMINDCLFEKELFHQIAPLL